MAVYLIEGGHFEQLMKRKHTVGLASYVEDGVERIDKGIDNAKDKIDTSVDNAKEKLDTRVDNAKEKLVNAKERIDTSVDNAKEKIDTNIDIHPMERFEDIKNRTINSETIEKWRRENRLLNRDESFTDKLNNFSMDLDLNIKFSNKTRVSDETPQTMVLASGNLGLIYFTDWSNRMTYEQIEDAFPGLINGLSHHEGIGFVMVKSDIYDTMVFSKDDVLFLEGEEYYGNHFLDKFGENIIKKLKRTDKFGHVPDILVNSEYNIEEDEVYAFEELIGSHGGAGGNQQYPFILYPSNWNLESEIFGAENVYKFFKSEIEKEKAD